MGNGLAIVVDETQRIRSESTWVQVHDDFVAVGNRQLAGDGDIAIGKDVEFGTAGERGDANGAR